MKVLRIENHQRLQRIDSAFLRSILQTALEQLLALQSYRVALHLVTASRMAEINQHYLNHPGSTDVITFDYRHEYELDDLQAPADLDGEIFISIHDAILQAKDFDTTWQEEIVRYAIHGFLHLLGFDDLPPAKRRLMKRKEDLITHQLAAKFNLRHLAR